MAYGHRGIGEFVSYPVPTRGDSTEAFDVVLKRKRLVVTPVEGHLVDGLLRPTESGRTALAEAGAGAA